MRTKLFFGMLIIILLTPTSAWAITQDTMDHMVFLLNQFEGNPWDNSNTFNDTDLREGLDLIYHMAVDDEDVSLKNRVLWAMGETGIGTFDAIIIGEFENEPTAVCYALGKIPSEDGFYILIEALDDEDCFVREAAAWGLGKLPYSYGLDDLQDVALDALDARLEVEEEDFILDTIEAALVFIETGVATSRAFETFE